MNELAPYGYEDIEKMYKGASPEWFWNLSEIEMDFGDGRKVADYLVSIGKEVRYNPDEEIWYISKDCHWDDTYYYNYPYAYESEHDEVYTHNEALDNLYTCCADQEFLFLVKAVDIADAEMTGTSWYKEECFEPGHFSCWETEPEDLEGLSTDTVVESERFISSKARAHRCSDISGKIAEAESQIAQGERTGSEKAERDR